MRVATGYLTKILTRLVLLLFVYSVLRLLFFLFHTDYFSDLRLQDIFPLFFWGVKFDISALVLLNSPFIVAELLPFPFRANIVYRKISLILFIIINSAGILANCVDLVYFNYTLKRTGFDALAYFSMGNDIATLLPRYLADFWYIFLIWLLLTLLLIFLIRRYANRTYSRTPFSFSYFLRHSLIMLAALPVFLVLYRGGLQLKPISVISAGEYTSVKNIPLVVNTTFSILKTSDLEAITEKHYMNERELSGHYSPFLKPSEGPFQPMNVVLIILEGFSKEYIGSLNNRNISYTPFLDSLAEKSLVFTDAYANSKRSIESLPAIVAGIPTLMSEPYSTSMYGSNNIKSLASVLRDEGYSTSFFHGGTNGTMAFDAFARVSGFEKYYGRKEYNNDSHYDGSWGIWDEEFFAFFAGKLNREKQPFFSAFFSLSSHHPFHIPEKYSKRFTEGTHPIHKSVRYTDHALKLFFSKVSAMPWFKNTLFVITADHTGPSSDAFFSNSAGMYQIPLLLYKGDGSLKRKVSRIASQADIFPTVLALLGYEKTIFSFGRNALDTAAVNFNVNYPGSYYQWIEDRHVLLFDGENTFAYYDLWSDSLLQNNLSTAEKALPEIKQKEARLKALIQTYNHALINNKMMP